MEVVDYKKLREINVAEQNKEFKEYLADVDDVVKSLGLAMSHSKARSRRRTKLVNKVVVTRSSPPRTRNRSLSLDRPTRYGSRGQKTFLYEEEDDVVKKPRKSRVAVKPRRLYIHFNEKDRPVLDPEEVTDEMIENVVQFTSDKVYDSSAGTCCHQCRQKTRDQKTVCRGKDCFGIRGQFCGPCLRNRYGEDVVEALRDPKWECPVCRDVCNCSFCRVKNGRMCTGIMIHTARKEGFSNVKDFLVKADDDEEEMVSEDDEE